MTIAAGYRTVSDFEIMFLIVAVFGFAFSVLNVRGIIGDFQFLRSLGRHNGVWLMTKAGLVNETGRAYLQLVFIYIAILSMRVPDPPAQTGAEEQILSAIARWSFLIGAVWVMIKTVYTWHVRRAIVRERTNGNGTTRETPA